MRYAPMHLVAVTVALLAFPALAQEQPPTVTSSVVSYTLRPGDVIRILVWGHEELSGEFQVDEEGRIQYPILGERPRH